MPDPPAPEPAGVPEADAASSPRVPRVLRPVALLRAAFSVRELTSSYGLRPLILLFAVGLVVGLDGQGFAVLQPLIKHDLGLDYVRFFTITSAIGALGLIFAGPIGYAADRMRRTVLVGIGGLLTASAMLLTGLAGSALALGVARSVGGAAGFLTGVPQSSLIVDYYPVDRRIRLMTFLRISAAAASILTATGVGYVAHTFGWRVAFYSMWPPMALLAILIVVALPEPIRGYQERRALGETEQASKREQAPPSWSESWRLIWSSRILRYSCYIAMATSLTSGFVQLRSFYFFQVWHQSPEELGLISSLGSAADVLALLVGGGIVNHIARMRPRRVFQLNASLSTLSALAGVLLVLAPVLWLSVGSGLVFGAVETLVGASYGALVLNVIPPRARTTGISSLAYWSIPGLLLTIPIGRLADDIGLQTTVLIGSLVPVITSLIGFMAAKYYEMDVLNAELSARALRAQSEATSRQEPLILVAHQLDCYHGSIQALFSVDFDVPAAGIVVILGTNGSGKSTLLKTLAGGIIPAGGAVAFDGIDITHLPPNEIAGLGIGYVDGKRSIFSTLTVRENLRVSLQLRRGDVRHDPDVAALIARFPVLGDRLDQLAGTLSSGEQHLLALAMGVLSRPRLLMIDELAMGLSAAHLDSALDLLRALRAQGSAVVVVEQSIDIALQLGERAVFMERGRAVFSGTVSQLRGRTDLLRPVFIGQGAGSAATRRSDEGRPTEEAQGQPGEPGPEGLKVDGLVKSYGGVLAVDEVSLSVPAGRILGLIGPNGAGKTTLLDLMSGFEAPDRGRVVVDGIDVTGWSPNGRTRLGLFRRFRDSRLFPTMTVEEAMNVFVEQSRKEKSEGASGKALSRLRMDVSSVGRGVTQLLELMHLALFVDTPIASLSTGTRRILDLAGVFATSPRFLLLDEPAAGLAAPEVTEMAIVLLELRQKLGCAIVIVEHDLTLISSLADDLVALHLGRVIATGSPAEVLGDPGVIRAYGGGPRLDVTVPSPLERQ